MCAHSIKPLRTHVSLIGLFTKVIKSPRSEADVLSCGCVDCGPPSPQHLFLEAVRVLSVDTHHTATLILECFPQTVPERFDVLSLSKNMLRLDGTMHQREEYCYM